MAVDIMAVAALAVQVVVALEVLVDQARQPEQPERQILAAAVAAPVEEFHKLMAVMVAVASSSSDM